MEVNVLNAIKDILLRQIMYVLKLMFYVKHILFKMGSALAAILDLYCQTVNAFWDRIYIYHSVNRLIHKENVFNVTIDISYQIMYVLQYLYCVTIIIKQLENAQLAPRDISFKMMNAFTRHLELILVVHFIQTLIAQHAKKDTI